MDEIFLGGYKAIREMIKYHSIMLLKMPKHEKFLLANKIRGHGYDIFEGVITLSKKLHKKTTLSDMNVKHELLRQLINIAYELAYIDSQKFRISQEHIDKVGKYIGYWIKKELGNQ
jgi:predicted metallo-beta-lactamase superfamily hydrolase